MRGGCRITGSARTRTPAIGFAVVSLAVCFAGHATGQTCVFNLAQPNTVNFGTIDPTLATTKTFSVTVNFKCTSGANATFMITGAHDTGPGAFRLQNTTQSTQFMPYTVSTVVVPGTKITLNGQLVAADYQNAYVGNYADTLSVVVLP